MKRATCGTRAGYIQHVRHDDSSCEPCREANSAYMRRYRRRPARQAYDRDQREAWNRATAMLRERHRDEFDAIYAEVKRDYVTLSPGVAA